MALRPKEAMKSVGCVGQRSAINLATLVIAVALSIGAAEIALRALGYRPWKNVSYLETPLMFSPDPEIGWRSEPGEYLFSDIPAIHTTIWPGGFRATAPTRTPRPNPIVLVGGSFMQGWAVSDSKTCGDRLQATFPSTEVLNLGTGAYGTYQSLLALERFLAESKASPSLVIYGFGDFHASRNVASHEWVKALSMMSQLGTIAVPHVSFGSDGDLKRNPPVSYPDWPLKRQLASVALLQDGTIAVVRREIDENPFTGETTETWERHTVDPARPIDRLLIDTDQATLYAANREGQLLRWIIVDRGAHFG